MKNLFTVQTSLVIVLSAFALLLGRNALVSAQIVNTGDCFTVNDLPAENCPDLSGTPTPFPTLPVFATPTGSQGNIIEGNIDPCFRSGCPTPSATPTPSIQQPTTKPTDVPGPTAVAPTSTPAPGTGGGSSNNSGSIQGATTVAPAALASTGAFSDTLMNMVGLAGVMLTGFSAVRYGKKS